MCWLLTLVTVWLMGSCGSLPSSMRSIVPCITSRGEKSKFRIQATVSTECISLLHYHKVAKITSHAIISWGGNCNHKNMTHLKRGQPYPMHFNLEPSFLFMAEKSAYFNFISYFACKRSCWFACVWVFRLFLFLFFGVSGLRW